MENTTYRYAGLRRAKAPGLSVANAAERLRRFAYVEQRLMRLLASRIVSIPTRDIKVLLARLQYEDALHAEAWRGRVAEMRTNKSKLAGAPDPALEILFDEAEHVPGSYPFLAVVTQLLKPALVAAYRAYGAETNDLADYPSIRLLRQLLADEEEHSRLLTLALQDIRPSEQELQQARAWKEKLTAFLAAAGGIDGTAPRGEPRPREASVQPYKLPRGLTRDESLPRVWDFVKPPLEEVPAHLDYMMAIRLSEINVAEGLAIVLCETPAMPWSFYLDISRHCWDEMRHSLFGEAAIEQTYGDRAALPLRDYEGVYANEASPLEQYAVLGLEIEGQNMKYPPGKRQEWEFARDMARHPLMTTLQDFDWADEVLHVNIARRQLDSWFDGGLKAISSFSKGGKERRTEVKQRNAPTRVQPAPGSR
ncbi:hypothetical protein EPA93_23940 [Ktedonosporobacter rubrisoli]|uniref:Ferritin-like domain-containing protein n=1 Tax=Ktedonosporobacter rubrisoli TaxID=2509675 RepID=A0A4P6JV86_KTERU|nr:hypothetical protein [Ktedonosporobacter rubrisoli]QBD78866.1 hypothetical protein EPA93_23940 [Ktedonosporobacter rubrisoli]